MRARTTYLAAWAEIRGEGALAWTISRPGDLNVMPCPAVAAGAELFRLSVREVLVQADMDVAAAGRLAGGRARPSRRLGRAVSTRLRRKSGSWACFRRRPRWTGSGRSRARKWRRWARCRLPGDHAEGRRCRSCAATADSAARLMQIDVGDAAEPRTDAQPVGRAAGEPSARARPHRHRQAARGCWNDACQAPRPTGKRSRARTMVWRISTLNMRVRDDIRGALRQCPDIERALSRLALDRGGPRDLARSATVWRRPMIRRPATEAETCPSICGGAPTAWVTKPCATCWTPRWSPNRRVAGAMAGSSRPVMTPTSTRRGRSATRGAA
jgi:DNA mismatch repair protein MutS